MVDEVNIVTHFFLSLWWLIKKTVLRGSKQILVSQLWNWEGANIPKNHTALRGMGIAAKLHSIYWTSDVQSDVGTSLLGQIVGHTLHSWSGSVLKCRWWKRNWHIIPRINWLFCIAQVRMFIHNLWFLSENESTLRWRSNKKVWKFRMP